MLVTGRNNSFMLALFQIIIGLMDFQVGMNFLGVVLILISGLSIRDAVKFHGLLKGEK